MYCSELTRWRTGANGVFGVKLHGWQWLRELAPRRLDELYPGIRCVLLVREDRLGQAISLVRARQTNQYRGSQPTARQPEYSAEAIRAALDELAAEEATWTRYFDGEGQRPLTVTYEQLVADYRGTVASVLDFIGAAPSADFSLPSPGLRRQADHLSEEWRLRFQRGTG
jgi:LPS sulfotransferase NodH